jgi:ferredoxin
MRALLVLLYIALVAALKAPLRPRSTLSRHQAIPLELEGKLDEKRKWPVKFIFNGEEKTYDVPESMSLLEFGESVFVGVESSCRNGICTTCAARILEGKESTLLAVHGLGLPQLDAGFVCACQCFVTGPGVSIKLGQYEECYEMQYGQYEKSYEMKYGDKKAEEPKKNMFGF